MKLPYKWLKDYTDIGLHNVDPKTYAAKMTMSGTMVGSFESAADEISKVVVGRIDDLVKHPNSDHLNICQVCIGDETVQIVTGAQNLKVGDLVPAALDGAQLPGGSIHTTTMRGEQSCGMLCSVAELGLTTHDCPYAIADGILVFPADMGAQPGDDVCALLDLDEIVFDFDILHNRPDCLSVIGIARESAATFDKELTLPVPAVKETVGDISEHLSVEIKDADLCPRYTAAMATDIKIEPSPKWMRDRLRNAGVRPINNIVDITNYVMLEYGQPMHAFDYACLGGGQIIVRRTEGDESCVTLDGQTRKLKDGTLVIADAVKPVAIAGVMGGENSEITENTKMIVFESACFESVSIRTTSRRLGMRTEASGRFEKGLDCENTMPALIRACQLVEELGAGKIIGGIVDAYPVKKQHKVLKLDCQRIRDFIGAEIPDDFMVDCLRKLDFEVNGTEVIVPFWRDDMEGIADIAEEVARYYGYDKIPTTVFAGSPAKTGLTPKQKFARSIADTCLAMGFSECKTLSFMSAKSLDKIALAADDTRRIATVISNPLGEDQSLMRTTALPAMLEVVARNYNYRAPQLRMFEQPCIYLPVIKDGKADLDALPAEKTMVMMAMYGDGDFFTLKGAVETLLEQLGVKDYRIVPCKEDPSYHPGRCASLMLGDKLLGRLGQIHPLVMENYGIGAETYVAELDQEALRAAADPVKEYHPLPKYPAVTRDLAMLVHEDIYVLQLEDIIKEAAGSLLETLELFDVYRGHQVANHQKSVAFSLAFRSFDHTLTDSEIEEVMQQILKALQAKAGAVLRS